MLKVSCLRLLFLMNLVSFTECWQSAVKYELFENFGQNTEEKFERSHGIMRRNIPTDNSSKPTTLPATTKNSYSVSVPYVATSGSTTANQTGLVSPTRHLSSTIKPQVTTMPTRTNITEDEHIYYRPVYHRNGEGWWFNIENGGTPKLHQGLSKNWQYSDTLKISFKFPYYGHMINDVTITNKGYVFLGEVVHKFNTSAQYVAPLMADFKPNNNTEIRYVDTGDRFTVEWANLRFQDQKDGEFSFQCSILKNGTLVFAYKDIPIPVSKLPNDTFPVRVGLSDSYRLRYRVRGLFVINRKIYTSIIYNVYYKYNTVKLPMNYVINGSAFVIIPLPNCVMFNSCKSCVSSNTTFSCAWCPKLKRCSDGFDRHRNDWIISGCIRNNKTMLSCNETFEKEKGNKVPDSNLPTKSYESTKSKKMKPTSEGPDSTNRKGTNDKTKSNVQSSGIGRVKIVLIILILGIILVMICWFLYAYRHPESKSGRFLIKHRNPRKWFRNSSEDDESGGGSVRFQTRSHDALTNA